MSYSPKSSHVATYLGVVGAVVVGSAALAVWPVTLVGAAVGVVASARSDKARGFFKKLGGQTGDLFLDAFHYTIKDLTWARDGLLGVFSKKEATQEAVERPDEQKLASVPAATTVFNTQVRIVPDAQQQPIPLAEPRTQKLDVTG